MEIDEIKKVAEEIRQYLLRSDFDVEAGLLWAEVKKLERAEDPIGPLRELLSLCSARGLNDLAVLPEFWHPLGEQTGKLRSLCISWIKELGWRAAPILYDPRKLGMAVSILERDYGYPEEKAKETVLKAFERMPDVNRIPDDPDIFRRIFAAQHRKGRI